MTNFFIKISKLIILINIFYFLSKNEWNHNLASIMINFKNLFFFIGIVFFFDRIIIIITIMIRKFIIPVPKLLICINNHKTIVMYTRRIIDFFSHFCHIKYVCNYFLLYFVRFWLIYTFILKLGVYLFIHKIICISDVKIIFYYLFKYLWNNSHEI